MIEFIKRIFIWWHDNTLGHALTMRQRKARKVGEDNQGNEYFEETGKPTFSDGRFRRWVVYHGVAEASRVPPEWHGWLHHILPEPPSTAPLPTKKFEAPYLPNMTGTPMAYRPAGSLSRHTEGGATMSQPKEPYEAWSPENA